MQVFSQWQILTRHQGEIASACEEHPNKISPPPLEILKF